MHYVQAKGILSAKNGMNLYRGCTHGCIYCDSRSSCYHMNHQFEDIEVKENAIALLDSALKHKKKKCSLIDFNCTIITFISPRINQFVVFEYAYNFTMIGAFWTIKTCCFKFGINHIK